MYIAARVLVNLIKKAIFLYQSNTDEAVWTKDYNSNEIIIIIPISRI